MIKNYFLATRPWSFVVSTMSVVVTATGLYTMGYPVNGWLTAWATIGILLFHAAGNVLSDYYDYRHGVDREDTFGSKTIVNGILSAEQMKPFGWILITLSSLNGLAMTWIAGWPLLIFGGVGALLAICYSWLKYHALGDLDILLEYGIIPALGTSFFVTGHMQWEALWFTPAFVTITMGVLHSNNTRDIIPDKRAQITTLPMLIGKQASMILYYIMVCLPIAWVTLCCIIGKMPWLCLLIWGTGVPVVRCCKQMAQFQTNDQAINNLDEHTAGLQLINCLVLIATMLVTQLF